MEREEGVVQKHDLEEDTILFEQPLITDPTALQKDRDLNLAE